MPPSRPVVAGVDDPITVRAMSLPLPKADGWMKREMPMGHGMVVHQFERELPGGNRMEIHVVDFFGPSNLLRGELNMSGFADDTRLGLFLLDMEPVFRAGEPWRHLEWVPVQRGPQRRFGAACRELHGLREERAADGTLYLWQDWMHFCLDPISHRPIEIDYAERFRAEGGSPSPTFAEDAAAFFDSIEFRKSQSTPRPALELSAAFVQANRNLFSNADQDDYPAAVLFCLDSTIKDSSLPKVANRLFKLKGTSPRDPLEQPIARYLKDERASFTFFFTVPKAMSGSDNVFLGDVVIHRALLPKGHLGNGSGYGTQFILKVRAYPATEHSYRLEHVGIQPLK